MISDEPEKKYWDYYSNGCLDEFDLIISCGDLPPHYLSFLVTFAKCPLLYVRGNHDDCYEETPPDGCVCIEDSVIVYNGVRIAGLGGSMQYKSGKNQYTEKQMRSRVRRLYLKIWLKGGIDIFVAHSPARHLHDGDDRPHMGFECFNTLIERFKPKYFLYGHVHMTYGRKFPRTDMKGDTHVVNGYGSYAIDI